MTITEHWYQTNLILLHHFLPSCGLEWDREEATWLRLFEFPLPSNFDQTSTILLLLMPGLLQPITAPPQSVYIDPYLTTRNGRTPDHVFNRGSVHGWQNLAPKGYANYCILLQSWQPTPDVVSGDNLLTVVNTIYSKLGEL